MFENDAVAYAWRRHIERFLGATAECVLNFIAMRRTWSPGYQKRIAQGKAAGCAAAWSRATLIRASPRPLIEGVLRRALKAKSLQDRAETLLRVLNNRDLWVAFMALRLARGQTRIYSAHSRATKTLASRHAEVQRAQARISQTGFGEELRVEFAPP